MLKSIKIKFEDNDFIVFEKPSGLLVFPAVNNSPKTLTDIVNEHYSEAGNDARKLFPCHRLDRETTGLIIYAKGKSNQKRMMEMFKNKQIQKKYMAIVHGVVEKDSGTIKGKVVNLEKFKYNKVSEAEFGQTNYKVIMRYSKFTLVEVDLLTGKTNQIRIHFKQIGHPLLGERKYVFAKNYSVKFKRCALHAYFLEFNNPNSQERIRIKSDLPNDMAELLV